ncbi:hypothetical protein JD844_021496 [Phrynosoma platyrhinos]|uniref:BZIP domain-containing protein n=1 Tax=Phrynosoma platyrhinos TaxID=52577 RepID=A0ABQ7STU0_PHRPL|nr:hypothetical protein JD844_021496 [Phrynosoma platyrhinos]
MVKQEQNMAPEFPETQTSANVVPMLNLNPMQRLPVPEEAPTEMTSQPVIKAEPREVNQFLNVPTDDLVQMPPTPPSSHGSDSDGSQSPRSLPPSSPTRPTARSSTAISSSPLLTAPHISAQESRRKKKEYVECLEKKVESYTSENNELWKKVETLENANRTLLQQLQKLQTLVTGKVSRPYKMASTQTGTCLMVLVLCFVLVLGSLVPCLPEFSAKSQTVKTAPTPDIYTSSKIQSRSLLFYDEHGGSLEEGYSSFISVEHPEKWENEKNEEEEQQSPEQGHSPLVVAHETAKYLHKSHQDGPNQNQTSSTLSHPKDQFHKRERNSSDTAEYL